MDSNQIRKLRLYNQQISHHTFLKPEDLVEYMIAMQAQEYEMAKWAVGLRCKCSEEAVELAFQEGRILRTHLMRPTWHFVSVNDIRWLLQLTAPQVHKANAPYYKKTGLTPEILKETENIIVSLLRNHNYQTRTEIIQHLSQHGIESTGLKSSYIMMYNELEGNICSGPRKGKQFTYALLDEVVPKQKEISDEEALLQFAARYIRSRGPVTYRDFAYWSNLKIKDAKHAFEALGNQVIYVEVHKQKYYYDYNMNEELPLKTFLLPDYDEYGMSYKDRSIYSPIEQPNAEPSVYSHWFVLKGRFAGTWSFDKKTRSHVEVIPFTEFSPKELKEVQKALVDYQKFLVKR